MKGLHSPNGAYRMPDRDRDQEQQLLSAFDAEIARQRAHDRRRVGRARYAGLAVSIVCAVLFAVAMAENLVKEGLAANGLKPLLACAAVVLVLALLVRRARSILRNRADLSRQRVEADITERVTEQVRAVQEARAGDAASARIVAEPSPEPAPAEDRALPASAPRA